MKNLLLASLIVTILPVSAFASELIPGTTLKLISPDGLTDLPALTVKLTSYCKYRKGILFPESKSCGNKTIELKVDENGEVKLPAIEKFDGLHGRKTDNYEVSLSIYDGEEYLAILSARGANALKKFKFENRPLSLFRLHAANINLSYQGADFFGSALSKVDRAMVMVSIKNKIDDRQFDDVLVISSLQSGVWARENLASYEGKELLKDATVINLGKLNYAKFNASNNETLIFSVSYMVTTDYTRESNLNGKVELPLEASALENIGTIELKK